MEMQVKGLERSRKKLRVWRDVVNGQDAVCISHGHWNPACIFLMVWLTGWTFACTMIVRRLFVAPFEWSALFMAIPFLAGEAVVTCIVLMMLFGKTVLTFTRTGGSRFTGIGSIGSTSQFVFPPDCEVYTYEEEVHGSKGGVFINYILMAKSATGAGKPVQIHSARDEGMIDVLHDIVCSVAQCRSARDGEMSPEGASALEANREFNDRQLLAGQPPKALRVTRDLEGRMVVRCRGKGWITASVFVGVVSAFAAIVLVTTKGGTPPYPVYIILGVIALIPVASLLVSIFGKREIRLDHGRGEVYTGVFGIGPRKSFTYGYGSQVSLVDSSYAVNGKRQAEILVRQPDGTEVRMCALWPSSAKPYIAAMLRQPDAVVIAPSAV